MTCYQVTENVCWYQVKKGHYINFDNYKCTSCKQLFPWKSSWAGVLFCLSFVLGFFTFYNTWIKKIFWLCVNYIQSEKVKDWSKCCPFKWCLYNNVESFDIVQNNMFFFSWCHYQSLNPSINYSLLDVKLWNAVILIIYLNKSWLRQMFNSRQNVLFFIPKNLSYVIIFHC